jgi:hypothetical protein
MPAPASRTTAASSTTCSTTATRRDRRADDPRDAHAGPHAGLHDLCVDDATQRAAFVGDTLFMPDYGTARCDFPGGDARTLYRSINAC